METIFVSLIAIVMLVLSTLFFVSTSMNSAESISDSLKSMDSQSSSIQLTAIDASFITSQNGMIMVSVTNIGQTNIVDFNQWDVLIQAQNGTTRSLTEASALVPASNQWAVERICLLNGNAEIFDPNILNPDEMILLAINPGTPLNPGEAARITIATANGVTSQCVAQG
jgi:hypothetical protein